MPKAVNAPTTIRVSSLERAHRELIAYLANARPIRIRGVADLADVDNVVDHLQDVFHTVTVYMDAVVIDAADHLPVSRTNRDKVEILLWDMLNEDGHGDLVRWLDGAGCRLSLAAAA
jgi:hypothetical protein